MASIGIMGGTFNPIHIGHIEIAKSAYEQYPLDEVWFMPNHTPAYKSDKDLVSSKDRMSMVNLAIKGYPYFKSSDFEIKRDGPTYSSETFILLHEQYPNDVFYFIMGADSLFYFEKWKQPENIVRYATILVAPRDEKNITEIQDKMNDLNEKYGENSFQIIRCPKIPCSSSEIRLQLELCNLNDNAHAEAKQLNLPIEVYQYILEHGLYL